MTRVVIGTDPHKRSVTIELMAPDEAMLDGGRYATDAAGFAAMLRQATQTGHPGAAADRHGPDDEMPVHLRKTAPGRTKGDEPTCKPGHVLHSSTLLFRKVRSVSALQAGSVSRRCHTWSAQMANPRRIDHGRGSSWEITYRVDGRMARRRFSTKKHALDALAQARIDTASGTAVLPAESKVTVAAYGERWMTTLQVRASTRYGYDNALRVHIGPLLGSRPLSSLRRSDVAAFVAGLVDKGLAPATVRSTYNVLAMLLRSAVYDRLLAVSPCYRVKVPTSTRSALQVLTPEQVHRLLEAAWDCDRAVLATAVGTGLRQGETLGLRLTHVNLLRRELAVEEQALTPPTGSPYISRDLKTAASRRVVPLPQFVVAAVARHLQVYGAGPAGELFLNRRDKVWRRGSFNDSVWKPTLRRAGLPEGYGFHALRHTYASGLIAENVHPRVIQARLGHKSITETMDTYGHLFPEAHEETTRALDRLFGEQQDVV